MRASGVSVRAVGSGHSAFGYHFLFFLAGIVRAVLHRVSYVRLAASFESPPGSKGVPYGEGCRVGDTKMGTERELERRDTDTTFYFVGL